MSPVSRSIQPIQGILKSSSLMTHFISRGRRQSSTMSSSDWWLATTTKGPPSAGHAPSSRNFQGG